MDHARELLAGDFIHIRDHQQKTLRSGIGRRQRTGGQRAVNGTGGAGLRLHLHNLYLLAKQIDPAFCRPFIGQLRHY